MEQAQARLCRVRHDVSWSHPTFISFQQKETNNEGEYLGHRQVPNEFGNMHLLPPAFSLSLRVRRHLVRLFIRTTRTFHTSTLAKFDSIFHTYQLPIPNPLFLLRSIHIHSRHNGTKHRPTMEPLPPAETGH